MKTVNQLFDEYLTKRKDEVMKQCLNMEKNIAKMLLADYAEMNVDDFFTPETMRPIYEGMIDSEMTNSYKARGANFLVNFVRFAPILEKDKLILLEFIKPFSIARNREKKMKILTRAEYEEMLTKIVNPMDQILVKLIYETGVGVQEIVVLEWQNFDALNGTIEFTPQTHKYHLTDIKSKRAVKLSPELVEELLIYKEYTYASKWLFPSFSVKTIHIEADTAKTRIKKYGWMIGLGEVTAYSIAQSKLATDLEELVNIQMLEELKNRYGLTAKQLLNKYINETLRKEEQGDGIS